MGEIFLPNTILICSKLIIGGYCVWSEWWDTKWTKPFLAFKAATCDIYPMVYSLCAMIVAPLFNVLNVRRTKKAYQMRSRVLANSDFSIVVCFLFPHVRDVVLFSCVNRDFIIWQTYIILAMVNAFSST